MKDHHKFRVWIVEDGIYFYLNPNGILTGKLKHDDGSFTELTAEFQYSVEYDDCFEQCTGLMDKNGKLIYEGDILETSESDDPQYEIVEWGTQEWIPNNIPYCDCEIIGNIHENPELLEAK